MPLSDSLYLCLPAACLPLSGSLSPDASRLIKKVSITFLIFFSTPTRRMVPPYPLHYPLNVVVVVTLVVFSFVAFFSLLLVVDTFIPYRIFFPYVVHPHPTSLLIFGSCSFLLLNHLLLLVVAFVVVLLLSPLFSSPLPLSILFSRKRKTKVQA
ncbi:hypothetical protein K457DRAFT_132692 [Linnemannia elongata AG-77]|uniref:Uncharacterized protein n=1 Tax=Linnemannia elongata AG-77 TaxID=1314771 RepID=A0A197KD25_9FUNG|nr:hypothetical protein K457DRAFT_132692 [Linnemannia elongata AG-77]